MDKPFSEVFQNLYLDEDTADNMRDTFVSRVTMNRAKDHLSVYLTSDHLIHKKYIDKTGEYIRRQIFEDLGGTVQMIEKYHLSGQYSARSLFALYKDSISYELKQYDRILHEMFHTASFEFTDDHSMTMTLRGGRIRREKEKELSRILEKIISERCGQDFTLKVVFSEMKRGGAYMLREMQTDQEVEVISSRLAAISREDEYIDLQKGAEKQEGAGSSKAAGTSAVRTGNKAGRSTMRRTLRSGKGHSGREKVPVLKYSENPDVLFGRDFEGDAIPMDQVVGEIGQIIVRGQIIGMEDRQVRNDKTLFILEVTDLTDTFLVKVFTDQVLADEFKAAVTKGSFVKINGNVAIDPFDRELSIGSVRGIKKIADFREKRKDTWPEKRVELHCHTKMSDMDGVSDVKDLIKCAMDWGMKAIAVTDHGNVQAFPDAYHAVPKDSDFKVIYGCEGYLVDDLEEIAVNVHGESLDGSFVVFDLETTGFSPVTDKIIEIGAVKVENGVITDRFSTFVDPGEPIPYRITRLTSISDQMVTGSPSIGEILPEFMTFCEGCVLVAHNASFDVGFMRRNAAAAGYAADFSYVDTVGLARVLLPQMNRFKLDTLAKALGVDPGHHHRAVDDAECTAHIFLKMVRMLKERDVFDLDAMNELGRSGTGRILKLPTYHVILLAKNDIGRVNLYRLVSESHLNYFHNRPRIPKSLLAKYRDGLLIGSACEAGELFRAVVRGAPEEELSRIVDFYDYLEIQPLGNNMFMTRSEDDPKTVEDLKEYNRTIVRLGEEHGKLVAATCDVHFLDPEDEIYRRIIMDAKKFKDADEQAPLYLHTTQEMLEEFAYLGEEKAHEVVITNTVKIADLCEKIAPVRPDKCPPVIENSDQMLTQICYDKAHEIYGEDLPPVVEERLKRELNSIISNGFAVMYIIAQKLVWKSNADGYLVGSRGSVGSSFVATMSGITEVNPLHPHYYCPSCHFSDFESPQVREFDGMAGCDMPDRDCPVCGKPLKKDGFDIPFETFLGFKGNKEPDIDLNFSGEYQSKAHKYTEVIFGAGQTFRAGTIGTLADKTAYGFVKHYFEDRGILKRSCEVNRLVQGCVGVRRTTGQHPGGIIVLPYGENIYSFTPVQHPANDTTTDIVTTHFDYHSIDHNLLKLDILGHDDPTMIRMLEDLTGVNAREIPLDDPQVMSLFRDLSALGLSPEQIGGCPLGSLGIPEFGTEFAIQMLVDTKPKYFSDLVRIAGLAHGTDVWLGNAQTLIQEGKATISTAICTRDDIMIYLIEKGLDKELAFTIMESVRKGKGLKPDWEEEMIAHDVPDWYIWSCKKIKYMFPKAHAAAYVMMAWRIAWFKINRPLAYYASYFSIRAPGFDYELMCMGKERLLMHMKDYEKRMDTLSPKEQAEYKDMKVVREMYERGFSFLPIDLKKVQANRFQIIDGKLMPSLSSIDGMGGKAAEAVTDAVGDGPFLSKEDFRNRTKVSRTLSDLLSDLGILKGLPETNQLSLFDYFNVE